MRLTITEVDYSPPELADQTPFSLAITRRIPGPDRPDYWLGRLDAPLRWVDDHVERQVDDVVVCARLHGSQIEPRVRDLPVNIAFVTDLTQLDDATVSFDKCKYVAIGLADEIDGAAANPKGKGPIMAGRLGWAFGGGEAS